MGGAFGNMMARHAHALSGHCPSASAPVKQPKQRHKKLRRKLIALADELAAIQNRYRDECAKAHLAFSVKVLSDPQLERMSRGKTRRQMILMGVQS